MTADHPLDYGYGEGSPLAKLVAVKGKVLLVGAPPDTMTLLHHAEHLARLPDKRVIRYEVPFATGGGVVEWRMTEEFDTSDPVVAGLDEDYFARIVEAFLATGKARRAGSAAHPACWSRRPRSPPLLVTAAHSLDARVGLQAARALRRLAETLEAAQVDSARRQGWSWQEIADALQVSKQAVHQRYARRISLPGFREA